MLVKKFLFSFKIIRIRDSNRRKIKKEGEKRCQEEKSTVSTVSTVSIVSTVSNFIRLKVQK